MTTHHYIISFDPKDAVENGLTMERAQALGLQFCKDNFPGHPAIVCTHPDGHNSTGNIHVHIVIGSIRTREVERKPYMQKPRDWLYVEDHCKAIDMVTNGGKIGEVYNVGGHNERPNIFIVKTIISQLHDRLQDEGISEDLIKHVADRLGHDRRYGIDPTKIKNDLGWYPETPFEKGIVLTIDWYLNHEEWMEHITSGNYQKYYEEMYKNK